MLPLICNNTWQGRINGSLATYVPAARLTGGPLVHTACHTTLSPQPSGNGDLFLSFKGQPLTSATTAMARVPPLAKIASCSSKTPTTTTLRQSQKKQKKKTVLSDVHSSESIESLQEHLQPCANEALFPPLWLISATNRFMFVNSLWVTAQVDDPPLRQSIVLF